MSAADLAPRREALATRFPAVAKAFAQGAGTELEAVLDDGTPIDFRVDGRLMFGGDARDFSARQVAAYRERPLRLYMDRLETVGLVSPVCVPLVGALNERLVAAGQDTLSTHPIDTPTFLIVFGLGLGHHLETLIRHAKPRWVILVEPMLGFFEHSLRVVDWPRLIDGIESDGGKLHVVTEADPGEIVTAIVRFIDGQGIAFADGAWIFTHYPFWAFAEARKRLHEAIEFAFVNRGFFEDELRMLTNAVENFAGRDFRLLEDKPRLARPEWAVIAGAGPSLDESFETLRRIRDRVLLFSCGTALRPLLRNGLVPDFHCELENVPEVHDVISEVSRYGDLSKITLVASATVDPRVPPMFGPAIFFFRDRVSSTEIYGRDFRVVPGASPTCVNLGMAAAIAMGCTRVVLFGTDCGRRRGAKLHADGTIYRDLGTWQERDRARSHSIEVEGNFGGVIETDWVYDACRIMLAQAVGYHGLRAINCSDGAFIPGARPCAPEVLTVDAPELDRAAVVRAIEAPLRRFRPGEMLAKHDLRALRSEADRLFGDLDRLLAEAAVEPDFAALYGRLRKFAGPAAEQYSGCLSIISGTLTALPRIAMFYGIRVPPELRSTVYGWCVAELRAIAGKMAEGTHSLLTDLADRIGTAERIAAPAE